MVSQKTLLVLLIIALILTVIALAVSFSIKIKIPIGEYIKNESESGGIVSLIIEAPTNLTK